MTDERRAGLSALLERLGLPVRESVFEILDQALTHRSWAMEQGADADNERLEFLGDAVISLATTNYLYATCPGLDEGDLSKRRAAIVSRRALGEVARELAIGPLMRLGSGELSSGGRDRSSVLGSALEAICGALYQHYEWNELRAAIEKTIVLPSESFTAGEAHTDYKSRLQEWTQRRHSGVPDYRVIGAEGPDHQKTFQVEVWIAGRLVGEGKGLRKKDAQNDAARVALEQLERSPKDS